MLTRSNYLRGDCSPSGRPLRRLRLRGLRQRGARLQGARLQGARQRGARLQGARLHRRRGAILSIELALAMPVLAALFFGMVEFSLLLSAHTRVQLASRLGCRVATLPATDAGLQEQAVREAVAVALGRPRLIDASEFTLEPGLHTGDDVSVEVRLPMAAASPNLLVPLGFSLSDRQLTVRTVMRKE